MQNKVLHRHVLIAFATLLAAALLAPACSGSEEGNRLAPCAPGEVTPCSCGPSAGFSTCQSNGAMGGCDCTSDVKFGDGVAAGDDAAASGGDDTQAHDDGLAGAGLDGALSSSSGTSSGASGSSSGATSSSGASSGTSSGASSDASSGASSGGGADTSSGSGGSVDAGASSSGGSSGSGSSSGPVDAGPAPDSTGTTTCVGGWMLADLAGSSSVGNSDGVGSQAKFNNPRGVAIASDGSLLVADRANHKIRKVQMDGSVITVAGKNLGSDVGPVSQGKFAYPAGVLDDGGVIYVADASNDQIRKVDGGVISVVAGKGIQGSTDGEALKTARFYKPQGVVRAADGALWVADTHNHRIRRIHAGQVETLAGSSIGGQDGKGKMARFSFPKSIVLLGAGALVADRHNHKIRRVELDGTVTTFAGSYKGHVDGAVGTARFNEPCGVAIGKNGAVWVADRDNNKIRRIANGMVETIAGSTGGHANGPALQAKLNDPWGITMAADGSILIGDSKNNRIRRLSCP
jgi:sugar lactone lactonase YvrE